MGKVGITTYTNPTKSKKTGVVNRETNTGNPLSYLGQRTLIGLAGVGEGIGKFVEGSVAALSGNENYAKYVFETSKTGEWRTSLDDQFNPDLFMQTLGAAGEGIGQSSVFLLNAAVPYLGTGMFATGIIGNSVGNAVTMTGDLGLKEYGYGITVGAAEAALEAIVGAGSKAASTVATKGTTTVFKSIGKATVGRAARNGVLKNILKEGAGEFMEEFLGDYVDVAAQKAWNVNKDAQYSLTNALYSGLVGAISGSVMGGSVELGNAAIHTRAGARVQKNGNVDVLMKQANAVSDSFGTMNSGWTKRTRMNQYIASIQASTDAYNRLSDEAKVGNRGALYLGEIEAAMFGLQATYGVQQAEDVIDKKAEKFADYASKISGKTYTAEDIRANKDNIRTTLAVLRFTGDFMTASEAEQTENEIKELIRRESAGEREAAAQFVEMGFSPEEAADAASRQTYTDGTRPISESGNWNGESVAYKMPSGEFAYVFDNNDGTYNVGIGTFDDFESGKIRIANQTREEVVDFLARVEENRILADQERRTAQSKAESAESQTSGEIESAENEASQSIDVQGSEAEGIKGNSENAETDATVPETKASLKKKQETDALSSKAKKAKEETVETAKEREKRTELATMQDRARKVVAGFDTLTVEKRRAIEEMYRSAEQSGADRAAADAAAHLLAILPDMQIRFTAEIGKNGLYDRLSSGERVILLNPKTDAEGGAVQTLLHEVTHHLENRAGYADLAKLAVELFGDEKANEVRERYREFAKNNGLTMSDEYLEQEVAAEAVGALLAKGKYVARMRNRSLLVNAVTQMGRWAKTLVGKNKDARAAALKLQTAFTKCLARTPQEAVEVMRSEKEHESRKYSYQNADQKIIDFVDSVRAMSDKSKISKRKCKIGKISDSHAAMIAEIIKQETNNDIDVSGYEIWIDGNAIQHIDNRHGINGDADQSMSDVRDIGMIPWMVNHSDGGHIARNEDGSLDLSEVFYNSDGTPAPIVLLHKNIGNQQYVVAECVPDSKAKRLNVVSAYKKSSSEGQVLNMKSDDSPQPTSEVPHDGDATTDYSIPQSDDSVKRKYSLPMEDVRDAEMDYEGNELTEEQQAFFKDSKVRLDEDGDWWYGEGRLVPVYHSTYDEFYTFSKEHLGKMTDGNASDDYLAATAHLGFWFNTQNLTEKGGNSPYTNGRAMKCYLNITKPYEIGSLEALAIDIEEYCQGRFEDEATPAEMGNAYASMLAWNGYDGIMVFDKEFGGISFVALEPEQIKDVSNNNPTTNPDIRYSLPKQSSELNKARREARTQANRAEREQARADRIKAELELYKNYQFDSKDIIEYADRQLSTYSGKLPKDRLRALFLNLSARLEYVNEHPNVKNAAQIRSDIDADIKTLAEEIAYNQKTEESDETKEIRKWVRTHKMYLPDELKGDLDRFGGEGTFRQKYRGKIILSEDGTSIDTLYPELTELFGEGYFPSDITNPADQLFRIADVVADEGGVHQSVDLDEMQAVLKDQYLADLNELLQNKRNDRQGEIALLQEEIRQLKAVNRAVENTALQEGYTRGYAEALGKKEKAYSKTDAAKTVERMTEVLSDWTDLSGYSAELRSDYPKSYLAKRIFYLMNSESRAGMEGQAEMLADNFAREMIFTEPETGRQMLARDMQDVDSFAYLRMKLADAILDAYDDLGKLTPAAKEKRARRAETVRLMEEKTVMAREMNLVTRVKSLADLASGKTKPSDKIDLAEMQAIAKAFSQIVVNGRVSVDRARKFAAALLVKLDGKELVGTYQHLKDTIYAGTLEDLRDIADGDAPSLTVHQITALNNLYFEFKHAYDTYNKVKIDGEWQEATPIAQKGTKQAKGSFIGINNRQGPLKTLQRGTVEFLLNSQDPLRTVAMLEGWCEDGVLSKLMYDVVQGEVMREALRMDFMKPYDDFFEKHAKYKKRLAEKTLKFFDVEITMGEAISLWLTAKREQAKKGLANSDIIFSRGEIGKRVAEGGWKRWAELSADERLAELTGGLSELYKAFTPEDLEFIAITENFFNKVSTETKKRADKDYYGHEMPMESYYFPISRDKSSIAEEIADASKAIANFITVTNLSFNKATRQYAEKPLYITNVWSVISNHATGLSAYATMYRPLLNFNTIWNTQTSGNKNSPESMKSVYSDEVWDGISKYLSKLMNDVQGISGEKSPLDGAFSKLRSNAVVFQLGLNPKTWLTQLTSLFAALDTLSPQSVMQGIMVKGDDANMDKYSMYARTRDYNMEVVRAEGVVDKIGKVGEKTMVPISKMDRMVIRRLWGACQVEVETQQGLAKGTEANMEAAGKLLDKVILRTQQTAGASTRSAFMRGSELTRSLTMFSADAMKQLSSMVERIGRYQRARVDLKHGIEGASERLSDAKRNLARTGGSLIAVAIVSALIAQLFKALYDRERRKKRDGSEMTVVEDVAMDSFGNVVSLLPIVREIYDYLDSGYEITNFTLDALNDIVGSFIQVKDDVVSAAMGEYVPQEDIASDARQAIYAAGMVLGVPTRNFNNILEGVMNVGSDELHWNYKALFKQPSYEKDLEKAINNGDEGLARMILTTWLEREKVGSVGDELDKLMELYIKGYDFLPSNVPDTVDGHTVTAKERKTLVAAMTEAEQEAAEMILSSSWQGLSEEAQAEALKQLYKNRQTVAKNELFGSELTRKAILSKLYGYQPVAEISGLAAASETIEEDGRKITKREQIEEGLKAYTGDEAMLLYIAGYTSEEARDTLKAEIYQLTTDEKERKALLEKLGIEVEEDK